MDLPPRLLDLHLLVTSDPKTTGKIKLSSFKYLWCPDIGLFGFSHKSRQCYVSVEIKLLDLTKRSYMLLNRARIGWLIKLALADVSQ